ncbi:trypsin-like peptidase domain-containing protein [Paenibacillus sp. FSL M8-0334]|uniref:S1C family serine protease n=1 Tax=Paenibacillus sp. FSL M8-0334 TaxID=2921623 RepID=UPI0030F8DE36
MDDQRKRFGYPDEEPEQKQKQEESSSSNESSYYYSYGPFRSISNDNDSEGRDGYRQMEPQQVEVTAPEPVKPVPTGLTRQSSGGGGQGGGLPDNANRNRNWNYSSKPRSSFKSLFLSFMAGVLVISGLMFAADRTNMFTPEAALSSGGDAPVTESQPTNSGGATPAAVSIPTNANDVSSVVDQASPSVVLINTFVKSSNARSAHPYGNDPFWYFFGGGRSGSEGSENEGSGNDESLRAQGIGSGFIFDKEGYILTNEHVIHGADVIQVTLQGNKKPYEAKLLGSSYELDLAVLKIEGDEDFPTVALGDSEALKVGEWLVAIGNPQGFDHTVTAGVLSSKERSIEIPGNNNEADRNYKNLLQTDASINPGNSGGPLLNLKGEVIGMNVAVSSQAQGIGFAIPSSTIKEAVDYLKNGQDVPKDPVPFIGAELGTVTSQIAQQLGTDVTEGSYVNSVVFGSPAYQADLRQYDIIVGVDGQNYPTHLDLIEFIQSKNVGDDITLNVIRNGKQIDLPLTIGDRNEFEQSQQRR